MANLSLTLDCNRDCRYCFAADLRTILPVDLPMSEETFEAAMGYLERSGIPEVRILGGEPTLHPQFIPFVQRAIARGYRVIVFTNGLWPDNLSAMLRELPAEQLHLIVNINHPSANSTVEWRRLHETLMALSTCITLGFNISTPAPDMDFLIALIDEYGLGRAIRVGLAHPAYQGANAYLRPADYPRVGAYLIDFMKRHPSVTLDFDCGFVPCMFPPGYYSDEELTTRHIGHSCGLIPDLLPDGSAIPCCPLAAFWRYPGALQENTDALRAAFKRYEAPFRQMGLDRACRDCDYRARGLCIGGCLAQGLRRLHHAEFHATVAARAPESSKTEPQPCWAIPYIDQPPDFWEELASLAGERICEVYFPVPESIAGSGWSSQPTLLQDAFLRVVSLPKSVLINPSIFSMPVEKVVLQILDYLKELHETYGICAASVNNLMLAQTIKESLPYFHLTASSLMDVAELAQTLPLHGVFDTLVPSGRCLRDLAQLRKIRNAFTGRLRLLVNEACLPECLHRDQHCHETACLPQQITSHCAATLAREPWLALGGSWILPQHLDHYTEIADEFTLAGWETLRDPGEYLKVLSAYLWGLPMTPDQIGGGPASAMLPMPISDSFFRTTLMCDKQCAACDTCRQYYNHYVPSR